MYAAYWMKVLQMRFNKIVVCNGFRCCQQLATDFKKKQNQNSRIIYANQ